MATRPVFVPCYRAGRLVDTVDISFRWSSGLALTQKKKNVNALHEAAKRRGLFPILEISTKSDELLGQRLSAFNLSLATDDGLISIESAYQGSKVFERGGPYTDLYKKTGREAKKDPRVKESGKLSRFSFFGQDWPLRPMTAFYDWLYLSALKPHKEFLTRLFEYQGFTDIEFNPERSVNCQARACALLVSLLKLRCLEDALSSNERFIEIVGAGCVAGMDPKQLELL
jgi:hypothetical protein